MLHAARLLDVKTGRMVKPGEILVQGERIVEVGTSVKHPAGAEVIDLGDRTLLPGLIDAHVHLFLHPGAEDLQTVQESVPQRTITATLAARDDLMAGFTAERDMGTEGAGSADTAVRNAINEGRIPGPRLRISGNAINILGGHEDAIGYNPEQHVLPNANYANNADELVAVMRQQFKEGADFIKIYETGADSVRDGKFTTPYQYTEAQLEAAVKEAARLGRHVAVHATGEPGTLFAAQAGVASIDHADQLSDETMRLMKEKQIFAVPTFTIFEYFAEHAATPEQGAREHQMLDVKVQEFKKQIAAGVPMAVGSDVGPFPHGTQAREFRADGEIRHVAAGRAAGRSAEWRKAAGVGGADRSAGARISGGRDRGAGRSAAGHWSVAERWLRDEGRRGLQEVSACAHKGKPPVETCKRVHSRRRFSFETEAK